MDDMTNVDGVRVRPDTRNHKGFFVLESTYKLVDVNQNGWALICLDDATCHYVDPDDLRMPRSWKKKSKASKDSAVKA